MTSVGRPAELGVYRLTGEKSGGSGAYHSPRHARLVAR